MIVILMSLALVTLSILARNAGRDQKPDPAGPESTRRYMPDGFWVEDEK